MRIFLFRSVITFFVITAATAALSAQDGQGPTGKIIEIHSGRDAKPSVIPLNRERPNGYWASGYPRLKDWKLPVSGDPVQAIDFKAQLIGDKGDLTISLFSGKRFGAKVETAAHVVISEGETIVVTELKKFGFEPITVKMLSTPTELADVPLVSNPSAEVRATVNGEVATLASFKVKFENSSPKDVMAIAWHTEIGGRKLTSSLSQGKYGAALIASSGSLETSISARRPDGAAGVFAFIVDTVVYRDRSFEGDSQNAEMFLGFTDGRKKALNYLVPILNTELSKGSGRPNIVGLVARIDAVNIGGPQVNGRPSTMQGGAAAAVITEAVRSLRAVEQQIAGKTDSEASVVFAELVRFYEDWQMKLKEQSPNER